MRVHDMPVSGVLQTPVGELMVTRAAVDQARSLLQLRDRLAGWMLERGIDQWRPGELPVAWVEASLRTGDVYVVSQDDALVGSVTVVWEDAAIWGDRPETSGYIHRLMIDRRLSGQDIGRTLLTWTESCIAAGSPRIRPLPPRFQVFDSC